MEKYTKYIVGFLGLCLLVLFAIYFTNIIGWILISAFLATLGNPLVNLLNKIHLGKFKLPSWVSAMLTLITMWIVLLAIFRVFVPLIINQVRDFQAIDINTISKGLEHPICSIDLFIQEARLLNQPDFSVEEFVTTKISSIINLDVISHFVNDLGGTAINLFLSLFSISFITFFFLKDNKLFDTGVLALVPHKYEEKAINVINSIKNLISRYLVGVVIETILMMIMFTVGLLIIGIEFRLAIVIGLIAGTLNMIPYIGPWIGASIGIILITVYNINLDFYDETIPLIIKTICVVAIAQLTDNIIFQPLIYSKSVKAHPLEIFIVIIIAGSLYGVLGMILAIPGYTVIRVIAKEFLYQYEFVHFLTHKMDIEDDKTSNLGSNE